MADLVILLCLFYLIFKKVFKKLKKPEIGAEFGDKVKKFVRESARRNLDMKKIITAMTMAV